MKRLAMMLLFVVAFALSSCAYGRGYWLFPQDENGYHFDPCLYPEKVRPEDREYYRIICRSGRTAP